MLNPGIKAIVEVCWRQGDKEAFFGLENNELRTFFWIRHFLVDLILGGKIFAGFLRVDKKLLRVINFMSNNDITLAFKD